MRWLVFENKPATYLTAWLNTIWNLNKCHKICFNKKRIPKIVSQDDEGTVSHQIAPLFNCLKPDKATPSRKQCLLANGIHSESASLQVGDIHILVNHLFYHIFKTTYESNIGEVSSGEEGQQSEWQMCCIYSKWHTYSWPFAPGKFGVDTSQWK